MRFQISQLVTYVLFSHILTTVEVADSCSAKEIYRKIFFFYQGFFPRPFTNHWTAEEGGGHFFNFSTPFPPASQTLRY